MLQKELFVIILFSVPSVQKGCKTCAKNENVHWQNHDDSGQRLNVPIYGLFIYGTVYLSICMYVHTT